MLKAAILRGIGALGYELHPKGSAKAVQALQAAQKQITMEFDSVNAARFLYLHGLFTKTMDVEGDIVECGVGNGRSFVMLAALLRHLGGERSLWGFDSFEGFPEPDAVDQGGIRSRPVAKGDYTVPLKAVQDLLSRSLDDAFLRSKVVLMKGFFEETLTKSEVRKISLLNLDVDLHDSYEFCLKELYPKVTRGGIITFDEFLRESIYFPGACKAIKDFFEDKNTTFEKDRFYGKYYVVKTE